MDNESAECNANFPSIKPKAESEVFQTEKNLVSKHAKFNVDFENSRPFRKTSVRDEKWLEKSPDSPEIAWNFFVNKPESALFRPERPTLIFFCLPRNRITSTLNNFPILCDLFPFSTFYCANEGKMFKNLIILKGSTLLDMMQIKFCDLLLNMTLKCCAS